MLEQLFTSRSRVKLLELLLLNPTEEFHLREISRRTDIYAPYVKREMTKLMKLGLVLKRSQGNMTLFRLNRNSPIVEDLKRIFLKTESFGQLIRSSLEEIGRMKFALMYGSFAEGEEARTSDIDLFVVGDVNERKMLEVLEKIEEHLGREVNYIAWTEEEFEKKARDRIPLLEEIIKSPVIMIVGDYGEFGKAVEE